MVTLDGAPGAGSRAGRYLFLRQLTTSQVGPLWEARCEGEQSLLALARVVSVPGGVDSDTGQSLAEAAWDSMELDGESVIRVADVVFGTGWFALVHDYWEGDTVRTIERRTQERHSAVPVAVALRIVLDAIDATQRVSEVIEQVGLPWQSAALNPCSLMVCDDGRTRLLDGFVGDVLTDAPEFSTQANAYAYAAPEQLENRSTKDPRTAVFRLGIIAWELLTGRRLLTGSKAAISRRLSNPIQRVDQVMRVGRKASDTLASVVQKALDPDPAQRFSRAAEFGEALGSAGEKIASQQDVIGFLDALAGRESTLARLLLERPPLLSEAMKSIRPAMGAKKGIGLEVRGRAGSGQNRAALQVVPAPPVTFAATPVTRGVSVSQTVVAKPASSPRVLAPGPAPAQVAGAAEATGPRPRIDTLVGLSTQELAAQASPPNLEPPRATQVMAERAPESPALVEPAAIGGEFEADDGDIYDEPTHAYSAARISEITAGLVSPSLKDSGQRPIGTSSPVEAEPPKPCSTESLPAAATPPRSGEPLADVISRAVGALPEGARSASHEALDMGVDPAPASEPPDVPVHRLLPVRYERLLLPLTIFFAATTLVLGILTVALVARSESEETPTDDPGAVTTPTDTSKKPLPEAKSAPTGRAPAEAPPSKVDGNDRDPDPSLAEQPSDKETESDASEQNPSAEAKQVVPAPVGKSRAIPVRRPRKAKARHYVPNDI